MRISDWSSDVCSSDLGAFQVVGLDHHLEARQMRRQRCPLRAGRPPLARPEAITLGFLIRLVLQALGFAKGDCLVFQRQGQLVGGQLFRALARSEEHTSELQSLMRSSYAVFCLKKNITRL